MIMPRFVATMPSHGWNRSTRPERGGTQGASKNARELRLLLMKSRTLSAVTFKALLPLPGVHDCSLMTR